MRSLIALSLIGFWLLIAPLLMTHSPRTTNPAATLESPSAAHWLGTDAAGRDVWSRTLVAGQRSILVAGVAAAIAILPAIALAALAVAYPRTLIPVINAFLNALLALPPLILALVILALLGRGAIAIALATGLAQMPFYARLALTALRETLPRDYVLAARAAGASRVYIIRRHLLTSARPILIAYGAVIFAYCLINSAALSLLGLSGDPSLPDWGVMLAEGRTAFRASIWPMLVPSVAISLTVMAINALADRLR